MVMPISYNSALGGVVRSFGEGRHRYFLANYAGVGFHPNAAKEAMHAKPLPSSEETGREISDPAGNYRPMALTSIGWAWQSRWTPSRCRVSYSIGLIGGRK
jgi:hypothetical protein